MPEEPEKIKLAELFNRSASEDVSDISSEHAGYLREIAAKACEGKNRAVLAVVITLLLKKSVSPQQDIRLHQAGMPGGFAGRSLDQRIVTPFLREERFPHMQSGSGWLTRSLEQSSPYNLSYRGKITPRELKAAFLGIIDAAQNGGADSEKCLLFMFRQLREWREQGATLTLAKPTNKSIADIVRLVSGHWESDLAGAARLPVLAIYAVYECLIQEVDKYKGYRLCELLSHTSADIKTRRIADIDLQDASGNTIEAVEIKHNIPITAALLISLQEKIAGGGVRTFYILSTRESIAPREMAKISNTLLGFRENYGCQVIANGVANTIKYYLRLLSNTDKFIGNYVSCMESDQEITFALKKRWNEIVGTVG